MSYILSAGTIDLPAEFNQQQEQLNLTVREIDDVIVFGQITDCDTGAPIEGAIVKVFYPLNGVLQDLCHTFTGCDGYYMIRIPPTLEGDISLEGQTITIMAVGSDCPEPLLPCECPEEEPSEP